MVEMNTLAVDAYRGVVCEVTSAATANVATTDPKMRSHRRRAMYVPASEVLIRVSSPRNLGVSVSRRRVNVWAFTNRKDAETRR